MGREEVGREEVAGVGGWVGKSFSFFFFSSSSSSFLPLAAAFGGAGGLGGEALWRGGWVGE